MNTLIRPPRLEAYLDDILKRQDFSRRRQLVERIRFPRNEGAYAELDPLNNTGPERPTNGETHAPRAHKQRL